MSIRPATLDDLPALLDLEQRCFTTNRLSRRALRFHITDSNNLLLVDEEADRHRLNFSEGKILGRSIVGKELDCLRVASATQAMTTEIRGYILLFRHPRSRLARIYSLAVDPAHRKQGIAERLLTAAEAQSGKQGLKLELRADNDAAFRLYTRLGYRPRREFKNFYEDGCTAIEMVKEV
jgi:ribosomal protein S18 acetylase RimI-like enzyme